MAKVTLERWFVAISPSPATSLGHAVVVWGRPTRAASEHDDDNAPTTTPLEAFSVRERIDNTVFMDGNGRMVQLVGELDAERAEAAGVPKSVIDTFEAGIPPAYELFVAFAASLGPPNETNALVLPGQSSRARSLEPEEDGGDFDSVGATDGVKVRSPTEPSTPLAVQSAAPPPTQPTRTPRPRKSRETFCVLIEVPATRRPPSGSSFSTITAPAPSVVVATPPEPAEAVEETTSTFPTPPVESIAGEDESADEIVAPTEVQTTPSRTVVPAEESVSLVEETVEEEELDRVSSEPESPTSPSPTPAPLPPAASTSTSALPLSTPQEHAPPPTPANTTNLPLSPLPTRHHRTKPKLHVASDEEEATSAPAPASILLRPPPELELELEENPESDDPLALSATLPPLRLSSSWKAKAKVKASSRVPVVVESEDEEAEEEDSDDELQLAPPSPPYRPSALPGKSTAPTSWKRRLDPTVRDEGGPKRKLAKSGATVASSSTVARGSFARRSEGRKASPPTRRASEVAPGASRGRSTRPARARKSAGEWWDLGNALKSLEAMKKRVAVRERDEEEEEEEEGGESQEENGGEEGDEESGVDEEEEEELPKAKKRRMSQAAPRRPASKPLKIARKGQRTSDGRASAGASGKTKEHQTTPTWVPQERSRLFEVKLSKRAKDEFSDSS
ncbi:hypothetical protein MNV49_005517 [Pseudohyphozyma bogoriensis]|nr:hypothetical protein MNV49_005517 [Pseudohyphozyma bogoriensis]